MSVSKPSSDVGFLEKLAKQYMKLLRERPMLTKSCTSAGLGALGSFLSQVLAQSGVVDKQYQWQSVAAYATVGFIFIGPTTHNFYIWLEKAVPKNSKYAALKRILLDRFVFAPPWLLVYFYLLAMLEGHGSDAAIRKIRETYWTTLKMNWRVWTVFQFVNVNYVPQQYRVPCMSLLALFWTIYVASSRK